MDPTLQATDLSFGFAPKRTLLHHLSFRLEAGTITLLAGPNGAGKSVLLKLVKGLLKETGGSIAIQGTPQKPKERMRHVGLVFQDAPTQIVGRTVEKDIRFGMENLGLDETEIRSRLENLGAILKLTALMDRDPMTLSGGEARRLAIAGVLAMQPDLLVMDEPFANLDWPSVRQVITTLLELRKRGTTILLVSHEVEKILAHVDHTLLLNEGTIVADGKPDQAMLATLRDNDIFLPKNARVEDLSWLTP
ncbi:MAG: energy-coupling factor ABC transporter ATP-binding protein [Sphaerochaeta sp.]|jgi:biotin transport system ATP-binding protein|nr:energy-coupling factor ABC transporter ATP-binding protein [Sphaerochaeta sp.]